MPDSNDKHSSEAQQVTSGASAASPLGRMSTQEFLRTVWQQTALFIPASCTDLINLIDGDELAGLACEESIDARIVTGHDLQGEWRCRQGPFNIADFTALPETNCSLLVQSVDQWHSDVHEVLTRFDFLPSWRLDDIMISYAAPGGSVGPHFDYYDVFLIQLSGHRRWRLGQRCDDSSELLANDEVKLLAQFDETANYLANPGDVLYVPSGLAHWGVAESEDCVTLSVGFRAPSVKEICVDAFDQLIVEMSDNRRYQDTLESIDEAPDRINQAAMHQLVQQVGEIDQAQWQDAIKRAFGRLVTDIRVHGQPPADVVQTSLEKNALDRLPIRLKRSPDSRLAYTENTLFADGQEYSVSDRFSQCVLAGKIDEPLDAQQRDVLETLITRGVIQVL